MARYNQMARERRAALRANGMRQIIEVGALSGNRVRTEGMRATDVLDGRWCGKFTKSLRSKRRT
jgi:hypothetical protein